MKYDKLIQMLKKHRYEVSCFDNIQEATGYLLEQVKNVSVGFGDSETLNSMGLAKALSENNLVIDPSASSGKDFVEIGKKALVTDIFFTSVNGVAETGEMVNIDGTGNRVAGAIFGHKKTYFVFGRNKIEPTLEKAIWRARNIAAPQNAKRLGYNTPCAVKGDRCYDCSNEERICNTMNIHLKKMSNIEAEIIIIDEELGF